MWVTRHHDLHRMIENTMEMNGDQ